MPAGAATRVETATSTGVLGAVYTFLFGEHYRLRSHDLAASSFRSVTSSDAGRQRCPPQVTAPPTAAVVAPPMSPSLARRRVCCCCMGDSGASCCSSCAGSRPSLRYEFSTSVWYALSNRSAYSNCGQAGRKEGRQAGSSATGAQPLTCCCRARHCRAAVPGAELDWVDGRRTTVPPQAPAPLAAPAPTLPPRARPPAPAP